MNQKKIGELISSIRKSKGLTQEELANKLGVGAQAVSKWERGINVPDVSLLNSLSKELNISIKELLSGEIIDSPRNKSFFNKKVFVIIFILIFLCMSSLLFYMSFNSNRELEKIYKIYSTDNKINLLGYAIFSEEKNIIMINKLELFDIEMETEIIDYSIMLVSGDKVILQINSNEDLVNNSEMLSNILEKISIEYIEENKNEENLMTLEGLNNLCLVIEFMNEKKYIEKINVNLKVNSISSTNDI